MGRRNVVLLAMMSAGCTRAPSVSVLGAYFPGWLFCITGSVLLAIAMHLALRESGRETWMYPLAVTYPVFVTLFSLVGWLIFFEH
jgi:hypothetical protein